jgi:hypothetical protein
MKQNKEVTNRMSALHKIKVSNNGWAWWLTPIISATEVLEIGKNIVQGQPVSKHPSQHKLGVVAHSCNPSYIGSIMENSGPRSAPGKKARPYMLNK